MAFQMFLLDDFGTAGGIFAFHHFDSGVLSQEFTALHQGDRVGVDFGNIIPVFIGQADKTMGNTQACTRRQSVRHFGVIAHCYAANYLQWCFLSPAFLWSDCLF